MQWEATLTPTMHGVRRHRIGPAGISEGVAAAQGRSRHVGGSRRPGQLLCRPHFYAIGSAETPWLPSTRRQNTSKPWRFAESAQGSACAPLVQSCPYARAQRLPFLPAFPAPNPARASPRARQTQTHVRVLFRKCLCRRVCRVVSIASASAEASTRRRYLTTLNLTHFSPRPRYSKGITAVRGTRWALLRPCNVAVFDF